MTQTSPQPTTGFLVALVEDGVPKFSKDPVRHPSKAAALAEAKRLAAAHKGSLFQVFIPAYMPKPGVIPRGFSDMVILTAFEPKVTTFTGRELLNTAPAGVYKRADRLSSSRFVVLQNGTARTALIVSDSGTVQLLHPTNWDGTSFVKTEQHSTSVLRGDL